jgi:hypothetical protein
MVVQKISHQALVEIVDCGVGEMKECIKVS